jgi:hypothetical protein
MTVDALSTRPARVATPNRFLVLWQSPSDRSYHRVGTLERDTEGYTFHYLPGAQGTSGFEAFAGFPDPDVEYRSEELFPMFANRVMTPRRDNYDAYVQSLGLSDARPEPFEVLARTLGTRATDLVQLLPVPTIDAQGLLSFYFLVHGSRHVDAEAERLGRLQPGDDLYLAPEDDNEVSPVAVLVDSQPQPTRDRALGYVPDVLAPLVRALLASGTTLRVVAEQVNLPTAGHVSDHMRLLARIDAIAPDGFDVDAALSS